MNELPIIANTELSLHDDVLDELLQHGFIIVENACPLSLFSALQQESLNLSQQFANAKLISGGLNQAIRSDTTRWLQHTDIAGQHYLSMLENLAQHLNQQLYSGIRRVEAHYAIYGAGDFYKLHRDNPTDRQVRVFSTVLYLNRLWQPDWYGELHLQDLQQQWHLILPVPNRLVLFNSNLLHEVRPAKQQRRSIAGWLRQDDIVL